jgi:hypothetical protein
VNCDNSVDFNDIDPLVDRIVRECCDPDCPGCEGYFGSPAQPAPEELAKWIENATSPELL